MKGGLRCAQQWHNQGISANQGIDMSNGPNKTVGNWRKQVGFAPRPPKPLDDFTEWLCADPARSAAFSTIENARAAYEAEQNARKDNN